MRIRANCESTTQEGGASEEVHLKKGVHVSAQVPIPFFNNGAGWMQGFNISETCDLNLMPEPCQRMIRALTPSPTPSSPPPQPPSSSGGASDPLLGFRVKDFRV